MKTLRPEGDERKVPRKVEGDGIQLSYEESAFCRLFFVARWGIL